VRMALGTVFPVGFRAAEGSRVMRVEARDYHAVAAVAPDVGKEVGRLAAHRMGGARGLEAIVADPPPPRAIVVGQRWDPSAVALRPGPGPTPNHRRARTPAATHAGRHGRARP